MHIPTYPLNYLPIPIHPPTHPHIHTHLQVVNQSLQDASPQTPLYFILSPGANVVGACPVCSLCVLLAMCVCARYVCSMYVCMYVYFIIPISSVRAPPSLKICVHVYGCLCLLLIITSALASPIQSKSFRPTMQLIIPSHLCINQPGILDKLADKYGFVKGNTYHNVSMGQGQVRGMRVIMYQ